jgi:DNA invertase Pin-like site-specific DNA recombinase
MVFVGYYRVSTDKQENSAEMQPIKLKQFADYKNIELLQVFGDEDVSGGIPFSKREQGAKLIELIESNPNIDGILVTNLTRAFRDAIDGLSMLTKWAQDGLKVYVIDEGGTIDITTPDGFMNALIKLGLSHWERLTIKKRTKDALGHMKVMGQQYARDKFGYDVIESKFVPNPSEQKVIQMILTMKNGMHLSYGSIAEKLNNDNIPTKRNASWHHTSVKKIYIENQNRTL